MKQLITVNLTTKSTDWQPPVLTFGESLTLGLRFQKYVDGNLVEPNLMVNSVKASIGLVDARPGGGRFALQIGADPGTADNTTETVRMIAARPRSPPRSMRSRPWSPPTARRPAKKVDDSWLLRFGAGATEVPLKVVDNSLWPISFGRISARQLDALWVHELRLVQAPVAFTQRRGGCCPAAVAFGHHPAARRQFGGLHLEYDSAALYPCGFSRLLSSQERLPAHRDDRARRRHR
ncbi:MAG: hypothetical protein WDN28_10205 [Chthoniobacter sp.]